MNVVTIESEAFKTLERMFVISQEIIKQQAKKIQESELVLLDVQQVADLTGYNEKTIRLCKEEIGFHTRGKNLMFFPADVKAWILKNYRSPRPRK